MLNNAYVFQHNTTGVQIFVYHCKSKEQARARFSFTVIDPPAWIYLGEKFAEDV